MRGHVRFHNGAWRAVIFEGRKINSKGKLADKYRWLGPFSTMGEAQDELTIKLSKKIEGSYVEPHKMTLAEYLLHWLTVKKASTAPKTHERYAHICAKNIIPALGEIEVVKLTALDIERFYTAMLASGRKLRRKRKSKDDERRRKGLSPTTVLQFHRVLHKALEDAVKKKMVSHNVAHAAEAPKAANPEISSPDENTLASLLAEMRQDSRVWLATLIAAGTGCRRGEILALRWRDIDFSTSAARVTRSLCQIKDELIFKDVKQKKSRRVVTLPDFVMDALRMAHADQIKLRELCGQKYESNDLVCCLPDGKPIPPDTVSWSFRYYRRLLGLKVRFHDLRHFHATQALQNGVPVKTVQQRLGHATAAFTLDRYGHLLPGDDERAASIIQRTLGAAIERENQKPIN
jgi:integrase